MFFSAWAAADMLLVYDLSSENQAITNGNDLNTIYMYVNLRNKTFTGTCTSIQISPWDARKEHTHVRARHCACRWGSEPAADPAKDFIHKLITSPVTTDALCALIGIDSSTKWRQLQDDNQINVINVTWLVVTSYRYYSGDQLLYTFIYQAFGVCKTMCTKLTSLLNRLETLQD